MPLAAHGEDVRAQFTVTAVVTARTNLAVLAQPATLTVSEEDIARGYVDVTAAYSVRNNDPAGYLLRLSPRTGLTSAIEVSGLATRVVMRGETVEILQPAALRERRLDLEFHLLLDEAAIPGIYEMPVLVAVSSI